MSTLIYVSYFLASSHLLLCLQSWVDSTDSTAFLVFLIFGGMVGNAYFCSKFVKVGEVQRRFAVLVSCFSYFFCYILLLEQL